MYTTFITVVMSPLHRSGLNVLTTGCLTFYAICSMSKLEPLRRLNCHKSQVAGDA